MKSLMTIILCWNFIRYTKKKKYYLTFELYSNVLLIINIILHLLGIKRIILIKRDPQDQLS